MVFFCLQNSPNCFKQRRPTMHLDFPPRPMRAVEQKGSQHILKPRFLGVTVSRYLPGVHRVPLVGSVMPVISFMGGPQREAARPWVVCLSHMSSLGFPHRRLIPVPCWRPQGAHWVFSDVQYGGLHTGKSSRALYASLLGSLLTWRVIFFNESPRDTP